ncbi:MAG: hypothetical protein R3A48_25510 [Polyangiales bacterium]
MRCSGLDLSRDARRTLPASRYRCGDCGHAIRVEATGWYRALVSGLGAARFIGVPLRVFIHEIFQVSGGPAGNRWYEWLLHGGLLLVGLLWGGGLLFAGRRSFVSVAASLRNPVVRSSPAA